MNDKNPDITITEATPGTMPSTHRVTGFRSGMMIDAGGGREPKIAALLVLDYEGGGTSGSITLEPHAVLKLANALVRAHSQIITNPPAALLAQVDAALEAHRRDAK